MSWILQSQQFSNISVTGLAAKLAIQIMKFNYSEIGRSKEISLIESKSMILQKEENDTSETKQRNFHAPIGKSII